MDDLKNFSDLSYVDTWWKSGLGNDITWKVNQNWLDVRIDRGDQFWMATDPSTLPPVNGGFIPGVPNGYFTAREYYYLTSVRGINVFNAW